MAFTRTIKQYPDGDAGLRAVQAKDKRIAWLAIYKANREAGDSASVAENLAKEQTERLFKLYGFPENTPAKVQSVEYDGAPERCPDCGYQMKKVPAGVSRQTGKPYPAFYSCSNKMCKYTFNPKSADDTKPFEAMQRRSEELGEDINEELDVIEY